MHARSTLISHTDHRCVLLVFWFVLLVLCCLSYAAILISEIQPNPAGTDPGTQQVELSGPPGGSFSGWLLSTESDSENNDLHIVERSTPISGAQFDGNGLYVFTIPDLENPSHTLFLVDSFTNDSPSFLSCTPSGVVGTVLDAIGIPDIVGDEQSLLGACRGGADFTFLGTEPELIFRERSSGDWFAVVEVSPGVKVVTNINGDVVDPSAFDVSPLDGPTFGNVNPALVAGELSGYQQGVVCFGKKFLF